MTYKKAVVLVVLAIVGLGFLQAGRQAAAATIQPDAGGNGIGSLAPTSDSGRFNANTFDTDNPSTGSTITPYYDIGNNSQDYTYSNTDVNIYVSKKNTGTITVNIQNYAPDCHNVSAGPIVGPDYDTGSPPVIVYRLFGGNGQVGSAVAVVGGGCGSRDVFVNIPVSEASDITKTPHYDSLFVLDAQVGNSGGEGENSFRVLASQTFGGPGVGGTNDIAGYGFRDININNGNHWTSWVDFALPMSCSNLGNPRENVPASISYFDTDIARNGTNGQENWNDHMAFVLERQLINDDNSIGSGWTRIDEHTQPGSGFGDQSLGNNGRFDFSASTQYRYRLVMANIGVRNTIRLQLNGELTQLYSKISERWNTNSPECQKNDDASCRATATDTTLVSGQGTVITVNVTNTGQRTWQANSGYALRQISPQPIVDKPVQFDTNPGQLDSFTFSVPPKTVLPGGNNIPQTYQFRMKNPTGGLFPTSPNPLCSIQITWTPPPKPNTPNWACTITNVSTTTPKFGDTVDVTVRFDNTGTTDFPGGPTGYQVRQATTGQSGTTQARTLNGTMAHDTSQFFTFTLSGTADGRNGPTPVARSFFYRLFNGTTAGASVVQTTMSPPYCTTPTITWGCQVNCTQKPPQQQGTASIDAQCGYTTVTASVPATYHRQVNPADYQPSQLIPGTNRLLDAEPITQVPVRITVTGPEGSHDFFWSVPNNGSANTETYKMWDAMWAHEAYKVQLTVEGADPPADSTTYDDNGDWGYYSDHDFGTVDVNGGNGCMEANCSNSIAPDGEPGQRRTYTYAVHVNNKTTRSYSSNQGDGYHFNLITTGGFADIRDPQANPDIAGDNDIRYTFTARLDFTGSFTVDMQFQGGPLDLPGLDHPCPTDNPIPATRPYFQVWNGDISVGGGYRNISDTCGGGGDPPYNTPNGKSDPNIAGIRSFANLEPAVPSGSQAEFAAFSLGQIYGTAKGPSYFGFFSSHGIVFANQNPPLLGGMLNSTAPAHCQNDFFTNTRISSPQGSSGGGNDINEDVSSCNTAIPASCQFALGGGDYTLNGGNIPHGKQITLYIDGNVTITGNITYDPNWDPNIRSDIPYFALVVRGNITTTNNVTNLDGLYIAQPSANNPNGTGTFSTCDTNEPDNSFCPNYLLVNGAVIAERVRLMRLHGSVGPLEKDLSSICAPFGAANCQPAEVFNYVPSMVLGAPTFAPLDNKVQGLFSLPPVF